MKIKANTGIQLNTRVSEEMGEMIDAVRDAYRSAEIRSKGTDSPSLTTKLSTSEILRQVVPLGLKVLLNSLSDIAPNVPAFPDELLPEPVEGQIADAKPYDFTENRPPDEAWEDWEHLQRDPERAGAISVVLAKNLKDIDRVQQVEHERLITARKPGDRVIPDPPHIALILDAILKSGVERMLGPQEAPAEPEGIRKGQAIFATDPGWIKNTEGSISNIWKRIQAIEDKLTAPANLRPETVGGFTLEEANARFKAPEIINRQALTAAQQSANAESNARTTTQNAEYAKICGEPQAQVIFGVPAPGPLSGPAPPTSPAAPQGYVPNVEPQRLAPPAPPVAALECLDVIEFLDVISPKPCQPSVPSGRPDAYQIELITRIQEESNLINYIQKMNCMTDKPHDIELIRVRSFGNEYRNMLMARRQRTLGAGLPWEDAREGVVPNETTLREILETEPLRD